MDVPNAQMNCGSYCCMHLEAISTIVTAVALAVCAVALLALITNYFDTLYFTHSGLELSVVQAMISTARLSGFIGVIGGCGLVITSVLSKKQVYLS